MNAAGEFVPQLIIFPRVHMKAELANGAPPGSIFACHKSGRLQSHVFGEWFHHFIKHTTPTADHSVLLILDGHSIYTNSLILIELARTNHVIIICLPPHTIHRLQSLDVSYMKPLNTYTDQVITKWLRNYPSRVITQFQLAEIFSEAYIKGKKVNCFVAYT